MSARPVFAMDDQTLSSLITVTALAVFGCSAWATFWIWRARRSGWARLTEVYVATGHPEASARRWQSIRFLPSGVRYPHMVTARLTMDGLYLVPALVCRFGHDPILIPWDDIEIQSVETYPADRLYDLRLARQPDLRLRIGVQVAQFIRRAADNSRYFAEPAHPRVRAISKPVKTPLESVV